MEARDDSCDLAQEASQKLQKTIWLYWTISTNTSMRLFRKSDVPGPSCWICFENEQSETNLIVRECACSRGDNGFVHVECILKLAKSKLTKKAFSQCITCKIKFLGLKDTVILLLSTNTSKFTAIVMLAYRWRGTGYDE